MQSISLHVSRPREWDGATIAQGEFRGKQKEKLVMANQKQFCPKCRLQSLKCVRTVAVELERHPLEFGRLSMWRCLNPNCQARFQLRTPEGKLIALRPKAGNTEIM